jgi:hypothetical protein
MLCRGLAGSLGSRILRQPHGYHGGLGQLDARRLSLLHSRPGVVAAAAAASAAATATPAAASGSEAAASTQAGAAAAAASCPAPAYKVPLDFRFVRDNLELVTTNCRQRNSAADPALVVALYDEFLALKSESEALRAARNENSTSMKVRVVWRVGVVCVCVGGGGMRAMGLVCRQPRWNAVACAEHMPTRTAHATHTRRGATGQDGA